MRICSLQTRMAQSPSEGLEIIKQGLQIAQDNDADLAIYPEMSLIGWDHHLHDFFKKNNWYKEIDQTFNAIQDSCDALDITALVGTPYQVEEGYLNAMLFFAPDTKPVLAGARKQMNPGWCNLWGFMSSPLQYPFPIEELACGFVFCSEVGELDELDDIGLNECDLIFWPGVTCNHFDELGNTTSNNSLDGAVKIANTFKASVVQSTYASQISPQKNNNLYGGCVVTNKEGEVLHQASFKDEAYILYDTLGQ